MSWISMDGALRDLTTNDEDALWAIMGRADVTEHYVDLPDHSTGWPRENVMALLASQPLGLWGIEAGGRLAGWCSLDNLDWLPPVEPAVYFSVYLHPEFWGHGLAARAVRDVLTYAFDSLGVDVVLGLAASSNTRSLTMMGNLGATPEVAIPYRSPISGATAEFVVHRFCRVTE